MDKHPAQLLIPLIILILAVGALWYVLTRPTSPQRMPEPSDESAAVQQVTENEPYYEIKAHYPGSTPLREEASIEADIEAVETMREFVAAEVQSFKTNSGVMELTAEEAAEWRVGTDRKYALGIEYTTYTGKRTVSYLYNVYLDTLGAHPNAYHRSFTFDLVTGAELSIGDLFTGNFLAVLSEKTRASLQESLGEGGSSDMLEAGTAPSTENFQTFYLTDDALVIVFSPYQVGPWAIGTQTVSIPLSELTILKTEYR